MEESKKAADLKGSMSNAAKNNEAGFRRVMMLYRLAELNAVKAANRKETPN